MLFALLLLPWASLAVSFLDLNPEFKARLQVASEELNNRLPGAATDLEFPPAQNEREIDFTPEAREDLIKSLPGLKAHHRRMYSGYIPVDGKDRSLFYWLIESDRGFSNSPVMLWTNGGPGCSGMLGLLTEQGPFRPNMFGHLESNPDAWTKLATMVFIEQPVGVGFSKTPGMNKEVYNDANAAKDNYRFVVNFFARFPELRTNEFYITSESYGGHYIPQLAQEIVVRGGVPNFKGFLLGNPLITGPLRDYGEFMTLHGHQLIPKPLFDQFHEYKCKENISSFNCRKVIAASRVLVRNLDPYALDFPKCPHGQLERFSLLSKLGVVMKEEEETEDLAFGGARKYVACQDTFATKWLNQKNVREALHVSSKSTWAGCNNFINMVYNQTDVEASVIPVVEFLMSTNKLKLWIYSGDNDIVCATASDQEWIWKYSVTSKWQAWQAGNQVGGFTSSFKGLVYSTVHGAGHMVPSTRPKEALELLKRFLKA